MSAIAFVAFVYPVPNIIFRFQNNFVYTLHITLYLVVGYDIHNKWIQFGCSVLCLANIMR